MKRNVFNSEDEFHYYNLIDCVRTREVGEVELATIESLGLQEVEAFQQKLFWPVLHAMQLGVRVDLPARKKLKKELEEGLQERLNYLTQVCGHPINVRSNQQMTNFFFNDLGIKPVMSKKTKNSPSHLTCDDNALTVIGQREPLVLPIIKAIREYRSLGVLLSTFIEAKLDIDNRMRCSYNICGTETYRFSSSKNAFSGGCNMQTIPSTGFVNVKNIFIPDEGYTFFDLDLDRADLQIVVWESGEPELKEALRKGVDKHLLNAFALLGKSVPLEDLIEGSESHQVYKKEYVKQRQLAKMAIHATNYGAGAKTIAIGTGISIAQAQKFQATYFNKYPGIKRWHQRVEQQLQEKHFITNAFGYRRHYFGSLDGLLPEALGWSPQSSVACVINRLWVAIHENLPKVQVLGQVHDSLFGQIPTESLNFYRDSILDLSKKIVLPYEDPLVIPAGLKFSEESWGSCK